MKRCQICGEKVARYICENCGASVCEECLNIQEWTCLNCLDKRSYQEGFTEIEHSQNWILRLLYSGFALVFIGMMIMMSAALLTDFVQFTGGGVIFIGPIPIGIVFGPPILQMFFFILFVVISIFLFFFFRKRQIK